MPELNKVDLLVKEQLLCFFDLYKSRLDVLIGIFLVPSSPFEWVENEDREHEIIFCGTMDYFESARIPPLELDIATDREDLTQVGLLADVELQNTIRSWVNQHINEYCKPSFAFHDIDISQHRCRAYPFDPERCLLGKLPRRIDNDWRKAALEVVDHTLTILHPGGTNLGENLRMLANKNAGESQRFHELLRIRSSLAPFRMDFDREIRKH